MKFRHRPIIVDAVRWFGHGDGNAAVLPVLPEIPVSAICQICKQTDINHGRISTLEGEHLVCPADWIITGVKGERYPCKPAIFELIYEAVL